MSEAPGAPGSGWYADPDGTGQRYWDGSDWTDNRAPASPPPPPIAMAPVYVRPAQKTNGLAIASMVLGIIWIYWIGSILAVIFGHVALSQIDNSEGREGGRGMAVAGVVLGWIGVATLLILLLVGVSVS